MEEYKKEFERWNKIKIAANSRDAENILIQKGAIWLMQVGVNIGSEMDGKGQDFVRPIIVVKKINRDTFFGVPISSKIKTNYFRLHFQLFSEDRVAVLSQLKLYDKKRCIRFMSVLTKEKLGEISQRLSEFFLEAETPRPHNDWGESPLPHGDNGESISK